MDTKRAIKLCEQAWKKGVLVMACKVTDEEAFLRGIPENTRLAYKLTPEYLEECARRGVKVVYWGLSDANLELLTTDIKRRDNRVATIARICNILFFTSIALFFMLLGALSAV